ncbi:eukaryotic translation initiation factor 4G [Indivirus ILV1]|uniref:Eukaryotic translation initiation factor 4G n=1 Tax=Indivirus ILV1 TaxID=1977633 RepID=A0A1V0SD34_9VIRU|nr:eukaryotic translation initiation factor 4G [Indivirus ILV1]
MSTDLGIQLTLDELAKYKHLNQDMHPELVEFYNKNKNRFNKQYKKQKTSKPVLTPQPKKQQKTDDEQLYSEFRSILNKLTETNFEVLSKDLMSLNITKREHLTTLANLILKKAILDKKFCPIYAKLSRQLASCHITEDKKIYFRDLLVNECQQIFNSCISYDPNNITTQEISKEKATGCIRFIGDIYNHSLLTDKIINSCFLLLLMKVNSSNGYIVECLCDLLKTSGKQFISKRPQESEMVFQKIDEAIKSGKLCNKDRFALMDMIDFKKANKF